MSDYIQVITTVGSKADADLISNRLVEQRLAGCVQVLGPIESTYRWKGDVVTDDEWLCLIKSDVGHYEELERALTSLHSYETPEIIATPITDGSEGYLDWLDTVLGTERRRSEE